MLSRKVVVRSSLLLGLVVATVALAQVVPKGGGAKLTSAMRAVLARITLTTEGSDTAPSTLQYEAQVTDALGHFAHRFSNANTLTEGNNSGVACFYPGPEASTTCALQVTASGRLRWPSDMQGAGDVTINYPSGQAGIETGQTMVTVTNELVNVNSIIPIVPIQNFSGSMSRVWVVPQNGYFEVHTNSGPAGDWLFRFVVFN